MLQEFLLREELLCAGSFLLRSGSFLLCAGPDVCGSRSPDVCGSCRSVMLCACCAVLLRSGSFLLCAEVLR